MKWKIAVLSIVTMGLIVSCSKKSEDDTTEESASSSDVLTEALTEGSSQASSTEGGTRAIASQFASNQMDVLEEEIQFAKTHSLNAGAISNDPVHQFADECKYSSLRQCSAGTGTVNWNGCSIAGPKLSITMTGGWTETWPSNGDCTNGYLALFGSVTRKSSGSVINFPGGATITTDTTGGPAYNGTVFATGGIIVTRAQTAVRSIAMSPTDSAIRKVYKGRRGTTVFDYYSIPSLTVSGAKANGNSSGLGSTSSNRAITGTVTIHHNLAKYTATNKFNDVTWSDASCCFPVSGSISTTFSGTGAPSGTSTLTFTSTCGSATFVNAENPSGVGINLTSCQ